MNRRLYVIRHFVHGPSHKVPVSFPSMFEATAFRSHPHTMSRKSTSQQMLNILEGHMQNRTRNLMRFVNHQIRGDGQAKLSKRMAQEAYRTIGIKTLFPFLPPWGSHGWGSDTRPVPIVWYSAREPLSTIDSNDIFDMFSKPIVFNHHTSKQSEATYANHGKQSTSLELRFSRHSGDRLIASP